LEGYFPFLSLFFFVFHNGPFAVFSSRAHGAQLKYDVWIFWETRIVSTKLFKISYRRRKKFGLEGAVARMGVENVSPACDRRQEHHHPPILSIPVTNYPWIRCYFTHTHTFTGVLSCIRKKWAACWRLMWTMCEPVCQFLYTICGSFVINAYLH
jgi:hypothetical protein